jgi:E3 ubiquitin-protein ligase DOA10
MQQTNIEKNVVPQNGDQTTISNETADQSCDNLLNAACCNMETSKMNSNKDSNTEISQSGVLERICRVCLQGDDQALGPLIHPCKCDGTLRVIHTECLKLWVLTRQRDPKFAKCEICHKKYSIEVSYTTETKLTCAGLLSGVLLLQCACAVMLMTVRTVVILQDSEG